MLTEEAEIELMAFDLEYLAEVAGVTNDTGTLLDIYEDVAKIYHRLYELENGEPYERGARVERTN